MKEGSSVPEEQTPALPSGDIPNSWGFHLLQELRHLEDKIDTRFVGQDTKLAALEEKIDARFVALEEKMDARFVAQDAKFAALEDKMDTRFVAQDARLDTAVVGLRQEISALRYWAWGSIVAVFVGTVTVILSLRP